VPRSLGGNYFVQRHWHETVQKTHMCLIVRETRPSTERDSRACHSDGAGTAGRKGLVLAAQRAQRTEYVSAASSHQLARRGLIVSGS